MPPPEISIPKNGPDDWLKSLREIKAAILAGWVVDGKGTKASDAAGGGRSVNVQLGAPGGSTATALGQLQTFNATEGTTPKIGVTVGQVFSGGSWYPRIGGVGINTLPFPRLTVAGGDTLIYLELTLNAAGVVAAAADVKILKGSALPASDSTHAYLAIAGIVVTTGAAAKVVCTPLIGGSQEHSRCTEWFTYPIEYTHHFTRI